MTVYTTEPAARRHRTTRDLCGDCAVEVTPGDYPPVATRYGTCARCGFDALVARGPAEPYQSPFVRLALAGELKAKVLS